MEFIADLHVHSPYSRATSETSSLPGLCAWARVKGISVVGTGDFTHPGWFARIREDLVPAEPGLFRLRDEAAVPAPLDIPSTGAPVRFLLTAEVSSIYKRGGQVRKIHNILFAPDLESASRVNRRLAAIGNIESDGRPILGLDARDLLEIMLTEAPEGFLVPAHIWTPWFSLFGSNSGFDSIEECFGPLATHVFALETGLSSDPPMNRLISALDRCTLISNSDCHSPSKLGREANRFACGLDYFAMREALKNPAGGGFLGTVEFFPEEGKYHLDGHRKCGVSLEPAETRRLKGKCPVCGRSLTVGVSHRVMELADREEPVIPAGQPGFTSLVPLAEVLGEVLGAGPATKGVVTEYARLVGRFGSEFSLLLHAPEEELKAASPLLAEAIRRMRAGEVIRRAGYDGEFGVIRVFEEGELAGLRGQESLFAGRPRRGRKKKETAAQPLPPVVESEQEQDPPLSHGLNPEQERAVTAEAPRIAVVAGPGTGKTRTLVARLARFLADGILPESIFAITFTNKAADEVRERLRREAGEDAAGVFAGTFHGFCLGLLREEIPGLAVLDDEGRDFLMRRLFRDLAARERKALAREVAWHYEELAAGKHGVTAGNVAVYLAELDKLGCLDMDGIIPHSVARLNGDEAFRARVTARVRHLFVDEFQDLNAGQYELVRRLAACGATVFAIGDPDQSIYGFRGSDPAWFGRFAADREGGETLGIRLLRNYRSAPEILRAAHTVILANARGDSTPLAPTRTEQALLETFTAPTPEAEAEYVVRRIEEVMGGISHFSINSGRGGDGGEPLAFSDIAVLYRSGRVAEPVAVALARRGIPFQQVGAVPFFMAPTLRTFSFWMLAASGAATNTEELELLRAAPGVPAALVKRLEAEAEPWGTGLITARASAADAPAAVVELARDLASFRERAVAEGLATLVPSLAESFVPAAPADELRRFTELAGVFGRDLAGFAAYLHRNRQGADYDANAQAVTLATMHAAKGLEFAAVFLVGLEEGVIPSAMAGEDGIEEERRLFYVALTRARRMLFLSRANLRGRGGLREPTTASRFLAELPAGLFRAAEEKKPRRKKRAVEQMRLF